MSDAPPPPGLPLRTRLLLAVGGVGVGLVATLAILQATSPEIPAALRPPDPPAPPAPAPAPAPQAAPLSPTQSAEAWQRVRALAATLEGDEPRRRLYSSTPSLQEEYPNPADWAQAAGALHDRLAALPEAVPPTAQAFDARARPGPQGGQEIVSLGSLDGGQTVLFFEGGQVVGFELR